MASTLKNRIIQIVNDCDMDGDTLERLVCYAYWMGREDGVRDMSDKTTALIQQQKERAEACRYHNMASDIIGIDRDYIYHPDYSSDMTIEFSNEETNL